MKNYQNVIEFFFSKTDRHTLTLQTWALVGNFLRSVGIKPKGKFKADKQIKK